MTCRRQTSRTNISKACSFCKARKRKCDGKKPCSFCLKKNVDGDCCYDVIDKRSIRFSHLKGSSLPVKEIKEEIEINEEINTETTSTIESKLLNFGKDVINNDNKALKQEESGSSRLLYDNQGNLRFIGESSPLSLLNQLRNLFSQIDFSFLSNKNLYLNLSKSKFVNDPRRFNFYDASGNRSFNVNNCLTELPARNLANHLVEMFFQNENILVYVFNEEFFLNSIVDEVYKNPQTSSPKKLCQLHLVLAIGLIYSHSFKEPNPLVKNYNDHQSHFDSAMSLFQNIIDYDGNLWMVETYILMSFYFQLTNRRNAAWLNLGQAIRIAESLGLNRKKANDPYKDKNYSNHRRKLWRSLYILDRLCSINLGRPLGISNISWDDRVKINLKEIPINLSSSCELYLVGISELNGKIYQEIYHKDTIDPLTAYQLALDMNNWSSNLPRKLKAENIFSYVSALPNERFYYTPMLLLHLVHLNGVNLLSRPFFHYYYTTNIQKIISNLKNGSNILNLEDNSIIKIFADSCLNSAIYSIKFCYCFLKNGIHPLKPYTLITNVFNSGLILGLVLLYDVVNLIQISIKNLSDLNLISENFNYHMKIMNVSILILKQYSQFDSFASRYKEILTDMLDSIESFLKRCLKLINENNLIKQSQNDVQEELITDDFTEWLSTMNKEMFSNDDEFMKATLFSFPEHNSNVQEHKDSNGNDISLLNAFMYNLKETGGELNF